MLRSPAATIADSVKLSAVHQRLSDFLSRLPAPSRDLLAASLLPAEGSCSEPSGTCRNDFYWLLFPEWCAAEAGPILDDVLWAQYCVYGLLRVQDDVVDGDAADPHLAVSANHLALEASRTLRRHFDSRSAIWSWFDSALAQTSDALVAIDLAQATPSRQGNDDLRHFARLSRCLTVGMRAALLAVDPQTDWQPWLGLFDHLAVASQILDDFHDLKDDLGEGRLNYAAWHLSEPIVATSAEATEAVIASNLATSNRMASLFAEVRSHLHVAGELLPPGVDRRFAAYLGRYQRTVDRLERTVASRRTDLFASRSPNPHREPRRILRASN